MKGGQLTQKERFLAISEAMERLGRVSYDYTCTFDRLFDAYQASDTQFRLQTSMRMESIDIDVRGATDVAEGLSLTEFENIVKSETVRVLLRSVETLKCYWSAVTGEIIEEISDRRKKRAVEIVTHLLSRSRTESAGLLWARVPVWMWSPVLSDFYPREAIDGGPEGGNALRTLSDVDDVASFARVAVVQDGADADTRESALKRWQGEAVPRLAEEQRCVARSVIDLGTKMLGEGGSTETVKGFATFFAERAAHAKGEREKTRRQKRDLVAKVNQYIDEPLTKGDTKSLTNTNHRDNGAALVARLEASERGGNGETKEGDEGVEGRVGLMREIEEWAKVLRKANPRRAAAEARAKKKEVVGSEHQKQRGVTLSRNGRWCARINVNGKEVALGTFDDQKDASLAYEDARRDRTPVPKKGVGGRLTVGNGGDRLVCNIQGCNSEYARQVGYTLRRGLAKHIKEKHSEGKDAEDIDELSSDLSVELSDSSDSGDSSACASLASPSLPVYPTVGESEGGTDDFSSDLSIESSDSGGLDDGSTF